MSWNIQKYPWGFYLAAVMLVIVFDGKHFLSKFVQTSTILWQKLLKAWRFKAKRYYKKHSLLIKLVYDVAHFKNERLIFMQNILQITA